MVAVGQKIPSCGPLDKGQALHPEGSHCAEFYTHQIMFSNKSHMQKIKKVFWIFNKNGK